MCSVVLSVSDRFGGEATFVYVDCSWNRFLNSKTCYKQFHK